MRRFVVVFLLVIAVLAFGVPAASAHLAGPCDDSDGDGMPSGREYAEHHISAFAQAGMLGGEGHIPGSHQGFSACLGVH
jgi:hypothetical protein